MWIGATCQRGRDGEHRRVRHAELVKRAGDEEENRQHVDEPQRPERHHEACRPARDGRRRAVFQRDGRSLEGVLDRQPEHVEIGEVDHLAVEVARPRPVDRERQEQARQEKEVRHAERRGEGDDPAHEARRFPLREADVDADHGVHHHHEHDADALGVVDPVDPGSVHGARPRRFPRANRSAGAVGKDEREKAPSFDG